MATHPRAGGRGGRRKKRTQWETVMHNRGPPQQDHRRTAGADNTAADSQRERRQVSAQMMQAFPALSPGVVTDVLHHCAWNTDEAVMQLSALSVSDSDSVSDGGNSSSGGVTTAMTSASQDQCMAFLVPMFPTMHKDDLRLLLEEADGCVTDVVEQLLVVLHTAQFQALRASTDTLGRTKTAPTSTYQGKAHVGGGGASSDGVVLVQDEDGEDDDDEEGNGPERDLSSSCDASMTAPESSTALLELAQAWEDVPIPVLSLVLDDHRGDADAAHATLSLERGVPVKPLARTTASNAPESTFAPRPDAALASYVPKPKTGAGPRTVYAKGFRSQRQPQRAERCPSGGAHTSPRLHGPKARKPVPAITLRLRYEALQRRYGRAVPPDVLHSIWHQSQGSMSDTIRMLSTVYPWLHAGANSGGSGHSPRALASPRETTNAEPGDADASRQPPSSVASGTKRAAGDGFVEVRRGRSRTSAEQRARKRELRRLKARIDWQPGPLGGSEAQAYLKHSQELAREKRTAFMRATTAFNAGDMVGARAWSEQGRSIDRQLTACSELVALLMFKCNVAHTSSPVIDLHGLTVSQALSLVNYSLRHRSPRQGVSFIVGVGRHSVGGVPHIKNAVKARLRELGESFECPQPAVIHVVPTM